MKNVIEELWSWIVVDVWPGLPSKLLLLVFIWIFCTGLEGIKFQSENSSWKQTLVSTGFKKL